MSLSRVGQTIDPEVLIQIESIISRMEGVVSRVKTSDYATLNTEFHKSLIRLSRSEVIVNLYNRLGTPLKTLQKISFIETKGMEQSLHEHKQIFKALKNGEISLAQSILKHHNQHVIDRIEKAL
jgi:DNA-binding GntR family transcriptional regulator